MVALATLLFGAVSLQAQINTPAPSPSATLTQTVGLTEVTIDYSRPGVKDRVIFAEDGLVPFGKMWRTGANARTKISFSDDVKFGGKDVAAGTYALFTIPTANKWTVILYTDYNGGGTPSEYDESKEAARFMVDSKKLGMHVESFTISVNDLRNSSASVWLMWEKTMISIPVEVDVDTKVMADIERAMAGTSARDYYLAASYYHDAGKDLEQALAWVKKANEKDPRFWQVRREALILADLGRYKDAIVAAEKSKSMAKEAGNMDYVSMNEKSIAEWSKMKDTKGGKKMQKESKS